MLTYRSGVAGAVWAALAMADHLLEQTLDPAHATLAQDYRQGLAAGLAASDPAHRVTVAEPRRDLDPRLAARLGLDPDRVPTRSEIANLLSGARADGRPIPGKQVQRGTSSLAEVLGLDAGRPPSAEEIGHVLDGRRADGAALVEERPGAARARLLALLGVAPGREASEAELAHVRAGRRADGTEVRPGELAEDLARSRARIGYVDLCWSADKSVSLAWAFAPTEAERAIIAQAHHDAVTSAMAHVEAEIGCARRGKAGRGGAEPGRIAWVRFDHYASRATAEVARRDPVTGEAWTELVTVKVAGDPQLHTHVAVPNAVLTEDGRVGALDLQRLEGRVHEWGALYQAYLATNLRRHGVEVALDRASGAARLVAIPERVRDAFSKRTRHGMQAARAYAAQLGLDWDALAPERKVGLLKQGVQGDPRGAKQDDLGDWASWRRQAEALDWRHAGVLAPERAQPLPGREARLARAYEAALGLLDEQLQRRAVLGEADARVAAARGLIASGIEGGADVDGVVRLLVERGARQDGQAVGLVWSQGADRHGRERARFTTTLHLERERELLALAGSAAADRSAALDPAAIAAAAARSRHDFRATEHGRAQRAVMDRLGTGGRLAVAVGVAGSGKSTLLAPLVDAWERDGRAVYGAALAWRQADALASAGIAPARLLAMQPFLDRAGRGEVALDQRSVVVVDEVGLLGTRQLLELLRLRERHGFQVVAVGDPRQCQAVEAGPVVELLRRALGPDAVPELLSTVRQQTERERETSLMFREGRAEEALARKREDGTARLVPGGHEEAVAHAARLWRERREANRDDASYSLSVSAPTNEDARLVAAAIRQERRRLGELGPDQVVLAACDQAGKRYELPLAVGDRVRLFARTNAVCADGRRGLLGNNGSVLEVRAIGAEGVTLRNAHGREGRVAWDTLRDPGSGRIRLTYGDVLSIDATQGETSTEHIEAMPAGTRGVNAYKGYTGASRHRRATFLVLSDGAERQEVTSRRPLGDLRPIRAAEVWANAARNLARAPEKDSALAFVERAHAVRQGAVHALQAGLQPLEARRARGEAATLGPAWQRRRVAKQVAQVAERMHALVRAQAPALGGLARLGAEARAAASAAAAGLAPAVRQAAQGIRQRPERVLAREAARRERDEMEALRGQLVGLRLEAWRHERTGGTPLAHFVPEVRARLEREQSVEGARLRQEILGLPVAELRGEVGSWEAKEQKRLREEVRPAARSSGPSPGM